MNSANTNDLLFSKQYPDLGEIQIRNFNLSNDTTTIHDWVTKPYAIYWGMHEFTVIQVKEEYQKIVDHKYHHVCVGMLQNKPVFLMEYYDPKNDHIAEHYEFLPGDIGMHILVAPVEKKVSKFTWKVFTTVMDFLFSDPLIERIVVEPDVSNKKIHALNIKAGFRYIKEIQLPHKRAHLAICTREDYEGATKNSN